MNILINLHLQHDQCRIRILQLIIEDVSKSIFATIDFQYKADDSYQISINIPDDCLLQFESEIAKKIKPLGLSAQIGFLPTPTMNIVSTV